MKNGKGKPPQKGNESKLKIFHTTVKSKESHRPLIGGVNYQIFFKMERRVC